MKFLVTVDRDEDGVWVVECPSSIGTVKMAPATVEFQRRHSRVLDRAIRTRHVSFRSSHVRWRSPPLTGVTDDRINVARSLPIAVERYLRQLLAATTESADDAALDERNLS